jgi:hypothetical protein
VNRTTLWMPVTVATLLAVLAPALPARAESPRRFMLELKFGPFRPDVDREFKTKTPWKDVFGDTQFLMTQLEGDYEFFTRYGVLAVGGTIGYSQAKGKGLLPDGTKSADTTKFHTMPLSVSLVYRFDWLAQKYKFPLVPVGKAGLDGWLWWATNGTGSVSRAADGSVGRGITFGGHATAGLMFLLDVLAPGMAQTFDVELGVNNTYLFAEYTWYWIDDFGSKKSMDLSSRNFLAGVAFEF